MTEYVIKNLEELFPLELRTKFRNYKAERFVANGGHYGSLLLKIDITTEGGDQMHLVAKCPAPNKKIQDIFNSKVTFKNEIAWYRVIIPLLQEFQRDNGLDVLDCFPKLYGSRLNLSSESDILDSDGVILLENLTFKGFKTESRCDGFKLEKSKLILRHLAAFHSVGMAFKIKKRTVFESEIMPFLKHGKVHPANFYSNIITFLGTENPQYTLFSERIKKAISCGFDRAQTSSDTWKAPIHNDFWVNNILINDNNEVKMIDFQIGAYASITLDLIFFLVISVSSVVAKQHMDLLIEYYYEQFMINLNHYGINRDSFQYKDFLEEIKLQGESCFARAMFSLLIVFGEEGNRMDPASDEFDPDILLEALKINMTQTQEDKCCFLVEEFVKRDWI